MSLRSDLLILVAIAPSGATLQAAILHYRGAFNDRVMFAPLSGPTLAIIMSIGIIVVPNQVIFLVLAIFLWLTFLIGFVGLGMHLRGYGRQMGGLYLTIFSWLELPPAFAPELFTGFAAVGLIGIYFL